MSFGRLGALALLAAVLIGGGVFVVNKLVGSGWSAGAADDPENVSTDPAFVLVVNLAETSEGQQAMKKEIAAAIIDTFQQRGLKPRQGLKYRVEASVAREEGPEMSIPLDGRPIKMPSEKLVCTLVVKFKDKVLYEKSKDILPDQNAMMMLGARRPGTFVDDFEKVLWKNVVPEFKSLAAAAPTSN